MPDSPEISRGLRAAAWIWLGYLTALLVVDALLYPHLPPSAQRYYLGNGMAALLFLALAHWEWMRKRLGQGFLPLMILLVSGAPILMQHLFVPRFPPGPLSNAEGMALRQMPVLFIGLALTAWCYPLLPVLLFSLATAALEMSAILLRGPAHPAILTLFFFVILVRTVSFIVIGVFIGRLMSHLRAQGESLRQANARLTHYASALENLTVIRERNRLARELHDTLAHSLTALSVMLETAKAYFDVDPHKSRELLDRSLEATRTGADETRRALKSLRASALEDMGLGLALRQLTESAAARAHLDLELALPDPLPNLAPDVEQCLYRVAQEAVENVVHHANAKRLSLWLESEAGRWKLTVQDDGLGFDPHAQVSSGHFGLVGMRERAELAGGRLTIESQKGNGTKVALEI